MSIVVLSQDAGTLDIVLDGLMRRYQERVPDVSAILDKMIEEGLIQKPQDVENDHIAFRTMGVPQLGIASLEKIFLHLGYARRDYYFFESKKLNAYWYAPPEPHYPRIFISELRVEDMPQSIQDTIHAYTNAVETDPVDRLDLDDGTAIDSFLHTSLWRLPTLDDYKHLAANSEYAAWVIYNRYYLNHFTISVHNLPPGYNTIDEFNAFLEKHGFKLNDSGGKAKVSGDGLLVQSSTVAEMIEATFDNGTGGTVKHEISGSYVEFAERRVLPAYQTLNDGEVRREHRREGFEAANADRIFESTYHNQTTRRRKQ
ncbi:MAG: DUF1338 domain-containing protein [Chloroflexi bacterium]|nr:DUF1338 domain-containing protein [Chloroflexota bacterium]